MRSRSTRLSLIPALAALLAVTSLGNPAQAGSSDLLLLLPAPAPAVAADPAPAAPAPAAPSAAVQPPEPTAPAQPSVPATPPTTATPPATAAQPAEPEAEAATSHASGFPFVYPETWSEAARFADLPGWAEDRQDLALKAFRISCRTILAASGPPRTAPRIWQAVREICPRAMALPDPVTAAAARAFFEAEFRPVRIARFGERTEADGFLTGYYEPEVLAARERSDAFPAPFHAKPEDLVSARGGAGFDARSGAGRWVNGRFLPYFDRGEIEEGALAGRGLEIAYARDPVDVMFTQIQGSARLRFPDGSTLRIGYAAHNGHRYVPVGRVMIERGIANREQMSMDFIRAWMADNPEPARDVRRQNRSYVFFRVKSELSAEDGPIGAQGVPVTDWRTIAVDRNVHAYGTPVFIEGLMPTGIGETGEPFRRLMVMQDTGSAIVGPARGDLYLGTGPEAGSVAGRIRHRANWFVLLPKSLSPEAAQVPVPEPRP
ncbi:MltA domain-containing protein [Phreatobacter sp.]|uniref:murein transglycosylase A n=1 Tax=Phreatobacter sp. TaxID=1966341 RepID=UPI0022C38A54|nr:MltA domain-containing protein [Phreatobacter sp.]MCZ8316562.1 MltA domain-containing protein [Phreatobacter sp.]